MASEILNVARAFDENDTQKAFHLLKTSDFSSCGAASRKVLLGLWQRAYATFSRSGEFTTEDTHHLNLLFRDFDRAISKDDVWPLLEKFKVAEAIIGNKILSTITLSIIWDKLPTLPYGFQYQVLSIAFLGDNSKAYNDLYQHLLVSDPSFVPDFWQTQSLVRVWSEYLNRSPAHVMAELLSKTGREDLRTLCNIYLAFISQTDAEDGFRDGRQLTDPVQKDRLASYLLGASQTEETMEKAVALFFAITDEKSADKRAFMYTRLAIVNEDWQAAHDLVANSLHTPDLKNEAVCLRALALAHLGQQQTAKAAIDHVRFNSNSKWFLCARANLINVTLRQLTDGTDLPNTVKAPAYRVKAGRPLAQSLWIGPRLRWIEEMSIRSYLLNGWRYQLYVYDVPESVPEGVEIMDAAAILPRSEIFSEGAASGMHKGSLGAFSDLFRYALIMQRGGMWTDTDVINLRAFEPDGARFISTERSDAGLIGLNGAMMAAPAGDALQQTALRRSRELMANDGLHFARIGPELLAEIVGDQGNQGYRLLPTSFLNPVGWMETGKLLRPFEEICTLPVLEEAMNIHVYTETWRLLGLSLQAPPLDGGFLASVYDRLMNTKPGTGKNVRSLIWSKK